MTEFEQSYYIQYLIYKIGRQPKVTSRVGVSNQVDDKCVWLFWNFVKVVGHILKEESALLV